MLKTSSKIEIRVSPGKGRGIFATESIRKGTLLEFAPYILIQSAEYQAITRTVLVNYIYDVGGGDCGLALGVASLFNHSTEPNADYWIRRASKMIEIRADRKINVGEELTIDYGYDPADPATWSPDLKRYYRLAGRTR